MAIQDPIQTPFIPYAYDKKTPTFAQSVDLLRFGAGFWDSRLSQVAMHAFFTRNPNLTPEVEKSQILEPGMKIWEKLTYRIFSENTS